MAIFTVTFIVLSLLGILDAGYLVWQHLQRKKHHLICPLNHDCSVVTESRWSRIFYVRNEVLGLLFYVGVLAAILLALFIPSLATTLFLLLKIGAGFGVLFSLFLVFVQLRIINDYCFYCMLSALITALLFINSFFL